MGPTRGRTVAREIEHLCGALARRSFVLLLDVRDGRMRCRYGDDGVLTRSTPACSMACAPLAKSGA